VAAAAELEAVQATEAAEPGAVPVEVAAEAVEAAAEAAAAEAAEAASQLGEILQVASESAVAWSVPVAAAAPVATTIASAPAPAAPKILLQLRLQCRAPTHPNQVLVALHVRVVWCPSQPSRVAALLPLPAQERRVCFPGWALPTGFTPDWGLAASVGAARVDYCQEANANACAIRVVVSSLSNSSNSRGLGTVMGTTVLEAVPAAAATQLVAKAARAPSTAPAAVAMGGYRAQAALAICMERGLRPWLECHYDMTDPAKR